ncbi:hypothetical protein [Rickettsiella endosymbiont of Miltochrista miniata]|uniref:hypothetical protein n=1 Tax=Rickettsiella endosymbiont of Miltochrista miniata TaxID=3066239 RepID=UPI00313BC186
MPETLWRSLPTNEANKLKTVIKSIDNKNLTNLSANQLIEKLENNQATNWLEVLSQYNAIPSINNMNSSEMLGRTKSVTRKFRQRGYDQLENREFQPNQLLSLVILCYSNPNLIGPNLCKALNDNNVDNIKKEILENSARVGDRVVPWASNLRLLNYALYANDTSVELPNGVLNRIREGARQRNISLVEVGGSPEIEVRSSRSINAVNQPVQLPLQVNATDTGPMLINGSAVTHNAVNSISNSDMLIGGWALFQIARNTPVGAIFGNVAKDFVTAGKYVGSFFSSKAPELTDQVEQKTPFLSSVAKP